MVLSYRPDFIPRTRRGAEVLLESAGWDPDILTPEQIAAIKDLYHINGDDRFVSDLIREKELNL
jgi:hypothetical protein